MRWPPNKGPSTWQASKKGGTHVPLSFSGDRPPAQKEKREVTVCIWGETKNSSVCLKRCVLFRITSAPTLITAPRVARWKYLRWSPWKGFGVSICFLRRRQGGWICWSRLLLSR